MKQSLVLIGLGIVLGGCIASKPPDNVGFGSIGTIRDLEGVYRNRGETGDSPVNLSRLIWPGDPELDHETIDTIQVIAADESRLIVRARQ